MTCELCEQAQAGGVIYPVRILTANVIISGCKIHAEIVIERLRILEIIKQSVNGVP